MKQAMKRVKHVFSVVAILISVAFQWLYSKE